MKPLIRQLLSRPLDTLIKRGLVAEYRMDQRNLLKWSEDFSKSEWLTYQSVITANTSDVQDPLGANTANKIVGTTDIGQFYQNYVAISGLTYTGSVWLRGTGTITLSLMENGNDYTAYVSTNITLTNTWTRYSVTGTKASDGALMRTLITNVSPAEVVYAWGAQLELGSTPTDYQKTTDLQTITDSSGNGNHGQSGSTTGVDTNDPTWTGQGLQFTTDDYAKLPYMINAEQDFTIYLVANVGAVAPSVQEWYWGEGDSGASNKYCGVSRQPEGTLVFRMANDAGTVIDATLPLADVVTGIRLLVARRSNGKLQIKDVGSSKSSILVNTPSSPITLNQASLGCLLRTTAGLYSNQPEYWATFINRATSDSEDRQQLRAIKKELAKRGVILGSKNEFYADFVGKVSGSTVENPNVYTVGNSPSLLVPSSVSWGERAQVNQGYIMTLDGFLDVKATTANLEMAQQKFSFNVIRDIEDKGVVIPGNTLAEKVQWCISNISSIKCLLHCRGTSPTGNKVSAKLTSVSGISWDDGSVVNHTSGTITILNLTTSAPARMDANGMFHVISFTEPSDGVTASTIYIDTCNLLITLKNGVVLGP